MNKICLILIISTLSAAAQMVPRVLQLRDMVQVESKDVTLGDLVASRESLPQGWASRVVMKSPTAGNVTYHALTSVAYALQQYQDMKNVTLQGEPVISIDRKDRRLEQEELDAPIKAYLKVTDPWKGRELNVKVLSLPRDTRIPAGKAEYRIKDIDQKTSNGYSLVYVTVSVDGEEVADVSAGVEIQELTYVWVARQALPHGHILTQDDLRSEQRVVDATEQFVSSGEDLVGYEVSRTLAAGSLMRRSAVRQPLCIRRGDWVAINAYGSALHITLRGKAMENGRLGERIMCVNERSQRKVLVELTGSGQGRLVRM